MNFDYSADQRLLNDEARKFLSARCSSAVVRGVLDDPAKSYDPELWQQVAAMGWLGSVLPEQYGGLGLGHVELCAIAEEMGRALAPLPFASTLYFFAQALIQFGSDEQKAQWLPRVADGSCIGCFAAAEGAGDPLPRVLQARVEGGRLHGTKMPVVDGGIAAAAVVLAQGEERSGLFLVDLSGPGVVREGLNSLDPSRGLASLSFNGVPAQALGQGGDGRAQTKKVLDRAASLLAFEQIGGADRCLEMAKSFALERYAFGRTIASYQAIKHKLADVYVRNELARSNAYYAAWALDKDTEGSELTVAAAAARIGASDAFWHASKENIQTHGGMGFTWEVDAHLFYRRAQQLALAAGAPRWWKERLIDQLERRRVGVATAQV